MLSPTFRTPSRHMPDDTKHFCDGVLVPMSKFLFENSEHELAAEELSFLGSEGFRIPESIKVQEHLEDLDRLRVLKREIARPIEGANRSFDWEGDLPELVRVFHLLRRKSRQRIVIAVRCLEVDASLACNPIPG